MTGTDVRKHISKDGEEHRRCTVSDLYIACDDGDAQARAPWICLQTQHYGSVRQGVWQPGWEHRIRWFSLEEFLRHWSKMEEQLNLVVLVDGRPWVARYESAGAINEGILRGLASGPDTRQPPRG